MEFRKLIGFGKNSYVISLPKNWVKKNKLNKGDTVYIDENIDGLQINIKEKRKISEQVRAIMISIMGKKLDQIQTEIVSAYLAGYRVIEVRGENIAKDAPKIKAILKELAGIELVEETKNKIVAKDLMNIEELSIKVLIRRTDLLVRGMIDDLIKSIEEGQYESIFQRDIEVNRLVYLTKRVIRFACDNREIRQKFQQTIIELVRAWKVTGYLEAIGDNTKRIARALTKLKLKQKKKKELGDLFLLVKKRYLDVMKAYHTKDINIALKIELESKIRLYTIKFFEKKNISTYDISYNLKSIASSIKHIARAILNTTI